MPFAYCSRCNEELSTWREAFTGCKRCDEKYYEIDDIAALVVIEHMLNEIDELQESVKRLEVLEEWLWENHHNKCEYRLRSQRSGMGDGCNRSIIHNCSRSECETFPRKGGDVI